MSTSVNPSAEPPQAPGLAGPSAVEPAPKRFPRRFVWIAGVLVVVAGAIAAWWLRNRPEEAKKAVAVVVRTAPVRSGTLERTIRIAGSTSAAKFANVAAPLMRGPEGARGLALIYLIKSGTIVKKGDLLAQLDTTSAKDHISDVEAQVQQAESDIRRAKADQAITEENMRQNIRAAKAALDKVKLDIGAAEIRTAIDQEELKLTLEEDEAAYKEVQNDFQTNLASQRAAIRVQEIDLELARIHLNRHLYDLPRFEIRSSMEGLAVMTSIYRGGDAYQVQQGDLVAPNQPFMKVVDPKSIQLEATINQVGSEELRIGMPTRVHFDAFPGLEIPGKVYSIGAIATSGFFQNNYVRRIPVKVVFSRQDPRVIPDLSASADVLVQKQEGATLVPREAVFQEKGGLVVYVKTADGFAARQVETGPANNTQFAVTAGLKPGEVIALERPPKAIR